MSAHGLAKLPERFDALAGAGVRGEESALAAATGGLHQPGECPLHDVRGEAGALEDLDPMRVRSVLLPAAVPARDELARDGRERAAAGNDLVQDDHADVEAGA